MLVFVRFRFSPSLYTASFLLYASSKAATAMVKIVVVRHICVVSFFSMNYERKRHCIVLILCTILAHDQVLGLGGYIQSTVHWKIKSILTLSFAAHIFCYHNSIELAKQLYFTIDYTRKADHRRPSIEMDKISK